MLKKSSFEKEIVRKKCINLPYGFAVSLVNIPLKE